MVRPMTVRDATREKFETIVVGAIVKIADLALAERRPKEADVMEARARAITLVDAYAHWKASVLLRDAAILPLQRTARDIDAIIDASLAGDVDGQWAPFSLPGTPGVLHLAWRCEKCGQHFAVEVHSRAELGPTTEAAAEQLARIAGWEIRENAQWSGVRSIRCPKCATMPRPEKENR
jgi:hypothetical protein